MASSNLSMISSRPIVTRLSRRDLRSVHSNNGSSRAQSMISMKQNRVSPNIENSWTNMSKSLITKKQPQEKQTLCRRIYIFLIVTALLILILTAIVALIFILIRNTQSNGSSQDPSTTNTTIIASTSNISSSSITNSTIAATSSATSVTTAPTTSGTTAGTTAITISTTTSTASNMLLRWNATGKTVAGVTSSAGIAMNKLDRPFGIALDSSNTLFIADQQNNRVQKWLSGASTGTTVAGQSSTAPGSNETDFNQPSVLVLDSSNNIYVTDTSNNRVQLWSNGASSGTTVAGTSISTGSANNELATPFGITRDASSGTLYIVDQGNHRVMSYLSGASSGTVVAGGNGAGTANTQLNFPVGIYFDSSSTSLYIANAGSNNIIRWVIGATSWTLVAGSNSALGGNSSSLLTYPVGVTLDYMGNIYVADRDNHRIQLFLAGQSNGTTIAGVTGRPGSNSTSLNKPYSIALDAQLNLYVADTYNDRVQKFIRY